MTVELPHFPHLPEELSRLPELACNLWWSWNTAARRIFFTLDPTLWRASQHNPVAMLHDLPAQRLEQVALDPSYLEQYRAVLEDFDDYQNPRDTWYSRTYPGQQGHFVYLCAEFAVHGSIPIYSGGLGLLAGDTCKEASDLGVPLIGLGCLYPEGYFHQRLEPDGSQVAHYERLRMERTALLPVLEPEGSRLLVEVPVGGRTVSVSVWKLQTGRVPIYLMDTDIPENDPWDRDVTVRLYSGDSEMRLRQEIILGIGGIRVLRALGYRAGRVHLNEGHAAFATLELAREKVARGMSFKEALEQVKRATVFTTHTPVKAGHDSFSFRMMEELFESYWPQLDLDRESFLQLGQEPDQPSFSMTILALRGAGKVGGVSRRHGEVSREMWQFLWPGRRLEDVPIGSITNGVHTPTWLAQELIPLLDRYLKPGWRQYYDSPDTWEGLEKIPDAELWAVHRELKGKLMSFVRQRARQRWVRNGATPGQVIASGTLLEPEALTIGFARRFATYKRAILILQDRERLARLLHDPWRPVQIIFAGKAHPADEAGKYFVQQVFEACCSRELGGRVAFVEDYDKYVAHRLVEGVDLWLNTPRPPQEASGTSGQKAALNAIPNFSVLDGWWCEGYNGRNGWAVEEEIAGDDEATAEALYSTLENEIIPLFFERDREGVPGGWIAVMKEAMRSAAPAFSARRMLKEYLEKMYLAP